MVNKINKKNLDNFFFNLTKKPLLFYFVTHEQDVLVAVNKGGGLPGSV